MSIPLSLDLSEFIRADSDSRETTDGAATRSSSTSSSNRVERIATGLPESNLATTCSGDNMPRGNQRHSSSYELSSVVVHTGRLGAGHYYCLARLDNSSSCSAGSSSAGCGESRWVKLDDHRVSAIDEQRVLELARGGPSLLDPSASSNAYLLFYTRTSRPGK